MFWPWNLIARGVGNFATNFGISGIFFLTYGPTRVRGTMWPCDVDVWPWRSWCLSVIRVFVLHLCPSLKSFQFRRYNALPLSALVSLLTLTFDLLTLKLVRLLLMWWATFYTDFSVSEAFHSRLIGQHLSVVPRDLATTFDIGGHDACQWHECWVFLLYLCTKFEVRRPYRSEDNDTLSVSALVGLVILTFDLYPLPVRWASILPILGFLDLFTLEYRLRHSTDRRTDRQTPHVIL